MLTRIKKILQTFTAPSGTSDSLNPFSLIADDKTELMPRIYRSTFWQRISDTYQVLLGKHFPSKKNIQYQYDTSKGLIDILIFPLVMRKLLQLLATFDSKLYAWIYNRNAPITALVSALVFGAFFITPLRLPRILIAGILTLAALPFVGIAHLFFKYKAKQIKKDLAILTIMPFPEDKREDESILINDLKGTAKSSYYKKFPPQTPCSVMPVFISKNADRQYCLDKKNIKVIPCGEQEENSNGLAAISPLYQLELMSKLPNNKPDNAKLGKIYLSSNGTYVVINFRGRLRIDTLGISIDDLPNRLQDKELKKRVLATMSKRGHIEIPPLPPKYYAVQNAGPGTKEEDLLLTNWLLVTSISFPYKEMRGLIPVTPENKRGIEALFKLNAGSVLGHLATGTDRGRRLEIYRTFINGEQVPQGTLAALGKDPKEARAILTSAGGFSQLDIPNPLADLIVAYVLGDPLKNKDETPRPHSKSDTSLTTEQQNPKPSPRHLSTTKSGLFSSRTNSLSGLDQDDEVKSESKSRRQSRSFSLNG